MAYLVHEGGGKEKKRGGGKEKPAPAKLSRTEKNRGGDITQRGEGGTFSRRWIIEQKKEKKRGKERIEKGRREGRRGEAPRFLRGGYGEKRGGGVRKGKKKEGK